MKSLKTKQFAQQIENAKKELDKLAVAAQQSIQKNLKGLDVDIAYVASKIGPCVMKVNSDGGFETDVKFLSGICGELHGVPGAHDVGEQQEYNDFVQRIEKAAPAVSSALQERINERNSEQRPSAIMGLD